MARLFVSSLRTYPLKGARAVEGDSAVAEPRGLAGDRRFVATEPDGAFLTQRDCPALARVGAAWRSGALHLQSDDLADGYEAAVPGADRARRRRIVVWSDEIDAVDLGDSAAAWLSRALGRPARLFHMDEGAERVTSGRFAPAAPISFADAYPVLIVNKASLAALNLEIEANGGPVVGMERFRPNVVIDGAEPWAEDFWATISVGEVVLDLVKPCDRCVVTTTDQLTGARMGKEPLASLARLRLSADPRVSGVLFGWNAQVRNAGSMRIGGDVRILHRREAGWALARPAAREGDARK